MKSTLRQKSKTTKFLKTVVDVFCSRGYVVAVFTDYINTRITHFTFFCSMHSIVVSYWFVGGSVGIS